MRARRGTDAPPSRPAGPAPTCRPRARRRRRRRPFLAKDEFEVELVVGATVCSSHRRGPGCCGSSGGGSNGGSYSGDSSSAPLHAGSRQPEGSGSATNFPGGDRDAERSVPNFRAGCAPNCTRSCRLCQPKPPQSPKSTSPALQQPPPPARSRAEPRARPRPLPRALTGPPIGHWRLWLTRRPRPFTRLLHDLVSRRRKSRDHGELDSPAASWEL